MKTLRSSRRIVRWLAALLILALLAVVILSAVVFMTPAPSDPGLAGSQIGLLIAAIALLGSCGGVAIAEEEGGGLVFGGLGLGLLALVLIFAGPFIFVALLVVGVVGWIGTMVGDIFGG
jgi:hypothetical protein